MHVRGDLTEVHARWREFAEDNAELLAEAKRLDDAKVMPVVDLLKRSASLLHKIGTAADAGLADDADKLGVVTFLRELDVQKALDTAGPDLAKRVLFLELKGVAFEAQAAHKLLQSRLSRSLHEPVGYLCRSLRLMGGT